MAEENSPTTPSADVTTPKKETVRITLPPKAADGPTVKRETVRINAPPAAAPKKETTHLPGLGLSTPAAPPPPVSKPFMPAPPAAPKPAPSLPKPPAPTGAPLPGIKPLSAPGAPKPPVAPRPTVPLRPVPPSAAAPAAPAPAAPAPATAPLAEAAKPVVMKPAAPKKETARIQIPPEARTVMPKATIKLQQTQPMSAGPMAAPKPATTLAVADEDSEDDPVIGVMSWIVLAAAIAAAALSFLAYSA